VNDYNPSDLYDFLTYAGLLYKAGRDECQLDRCPFCEQDRTKKSDHFSFAIETGQYHCIKCDAKGNLITFKRELGYEPFKLKVYTRPVQDVVKKYAEQPESYYEAYQKTRGIPVEVLKKYGVGKINHPMLGSCRTYQYVDTDFSIVNVKYVNKDKKMLQEKNAKQIYYGIQHIDFTKEYLHVVEGEDDCHAMVALGFDNVVSVPGGAGFYSEEMGQINSKFRTIHLIFDNDEAGQKGAQKFANKAGVWKCRNALVPFKDVRDCLLNGVDYFAIQTCIEKATAFQYDPMATERPAVDIATRLERYEADAAINQAGVKFDLAVIDDVVSGLRGGEVMVIISNPGCFKTTTLMNLLYRGTISRPEGIGVFFSLEMQIEAEVEREIRMMMQPEEPWTIRRHAIDKSEYWKKLKRDVAESQANRIFVSDENSLTVAKMMNVIKNTEECTGQKVTLIGIDYLDFVEAKSNKEYEAVKEVMIQIKRTMAKTLNVPVIVLAQTSRENKDSEEEVGARSGKGGTPIEATSDFLIGLWRDKDRIIGRFSKHRRTEYRVEYPYFTINLDKKNYFVVDVVACEKPVKKRNKKFEDEK
jgi:5S rRNA maturation endonuclease (ribonuclease M5)/KaiC/GvpD/RAD55 family RecA-like ATPase